MTPPETTDEKRSRSYWGFGLVGAVVIVAAAFIFWPRAGGRQQLSLKVLGYKNYAPFEYELRPGPHGKLVLARVAVTNNTNETLLLGSSGSYTELFVLQQAKSGRKRPEVLVWFPVGQAEWSGNLLPGQGFTIDAIIPTDKPYKVGVDYLNGRLSARIWQKLPAWLTKKLSWASPWRTATTEVIDPSKPP